MSLVYFFQLQVFFLKHVIDQPYCQPGLRSIKTSLIKTFKNLYSCQDFSNCAFLRIFFCCFLVYLKLNHGFYFRGYILACLCSLKKIIQKVQFLKRLLFTNSRCTLVWSQKYTCWFKICKNFISYQKEMGKWTLFERQK